MNNGQSPTAAAQSRANSQHIHPRLTEGLRQTEGKQLRLVTARKSAGQTIAANPGQSDACVLVH